MLNMSDRDWNLLLGRIKAGKCTPFLGAGASFGVFPLGSEIATQWAQEHGYPLKDSRDLARVAQFIAVTIDPMAPKEKIQKQFQNLLLPDFTSPNEPHRVLADLPFPIYMTTNYDDSMTSALKRIRIRSGSCVVGIHMSRRMKNLSSTKIKITLLVYPIPWYFTFTDISMCQNLSC